MVVSAISALVLAACGGSDNGNPVSAPVVSQLCPQSDDVADSVLHFTRNADGTISAGVPIQTGGKGTGGEQYDLYAGAFDFVVLLPPTIYIPPGDVRLDLLRVSDARSTWCEFKGAAHYLDAIVGDRRRPAVAWSYARPSPGYRVLRDHVAFYPGRVDAAWVGEERVEAQEGDFYGGWVTSEVVGPFKGAPGTAGW